MNIGINGFGRIGRLVFRALWGRPGIRIVHVNDPAGDAAAAAHLLSFDSVHGRWAPTVEAQGAGFAVAGTAVTWTRHSDPTAVPWRDADVQMVLECSGRIKTPETLQPYFDAVGLRHVIVACPVKGVVAGEEALNIVYGINHQQVDPGRHRLLTAASCTTNCWPRSCRWCTAASASAMGRSPPCMTSPTPRWWSMPSRATCAGPARAVRA